MIKNKAIENIANILKAEGIKDILFIDCNSNMCDSCIEELEKQLDLKNCNLININKIKKGYSKEIDLNKTIIVTLGLWYYSSESRSKEFQDLLTSGVMPIFYIMEDLEEWRGEDVEKGSYN